MSCVDQILMEIWVKMLTWIVPFHREYLANNVSVTVYPVNEPWLYSILWCSGVPSVSSDAPQVLRKVPCPIWLMVNSSPLSVSHLTVHTHTLTQTRSHSETRGQQERGQRLTRAQQDSRARTERNMRGLSGRLLPSVSFREQQDHRKDSGANRDKGMDLNWKSSWLLVRTLPCLHCRSLETTSLCLFLSCRARMLITLSGSPQISSPSP